MRTAGSTISAVAFFALCATLYAVGHLSWRRTRGTRRGWESSRAPPESISATTAPLTWLAALAGVAASGWGAAVVAASIPAGLGLLAGGASVALAGSWSRVRRVAADQRGMTVHAARGPPFNLAWSDLLVLRPPRTPVGGWRFQGRSASRTLMPSDLWGMEALLQIATRSGDLWFDGRRWRKARLKKESGQG